MKSHSGLSAFCRKASSSVCVLSWTVVAFSLKVEIVLRAADVMADEQLGVLLNDVALSRLHGSGPLDAEVDLIC